MKSALAPTLLLLGALTGCTIPRSAPVDAATGTERAEVIQTAQAMFDAMSTRDTATLRRLLMPEAMLFVADERHPRVYIDGGVAILWARYTFHRNDRQSHCGHDGFHFVRADGQWRIASIIFTMRPKSACDAQK
jgi:hypothetical protein